MGPEEQPYSDGAPRAVPPATELPEFIRPATGPSGFGPVVSPPPVCGPPEAVNPANPVSPSGSRASGAASAETVQGAVRRIGGALLRACHPLPSVTVTVLATALAMSAGRSSSGCVLVAGAVLTGQLAVGWSNDAIDAHRDRAVGRTDKPVASGAVPVGTVRAAAWVALVLCVPLSLAGGALGGAVHLVGVAAAWAYNLGVKGTLWSWVPYAVGFGSLPAFVTLGLPGRPWPAWWAVVSAVLLGVGAHLVNVLPDIGDDLRTGVRGWPQRLGPSGVRLLAPVPLLAATLLLALARPGPVDGIGGAAVAVTAVAAAAGTLLGRRRRRTRVPLVTAIAVAAVDVGLLLGRGSWIA